MVQSLVGAYTGGNQWVLEWVEQQTNISLSLSLPLTLKKKVSEEWGSAFQHFTHWTLPVLLVGLSYGSNGGLGKLNNLQSDRAALKWHLVYQTRSKAPKHHVNQLCELGMLKIWVPAPLHGASDFCSFCPKGRHPFVTSLPYGSDTLWTRGDRTLWLRTTRSSSQRLTKIAFAWHPCQCVTVHFLQLYSKETSLFWKKVK